MYDAKYWENYYKWCKEGCELEGLEFNDTLEEFIEKEKAKEEKLKQKRSDDIERHNWLYGGN